MWPWNASTMGFVYLLHFSAPIGNAANPRAMAFHYVGFADDIEKRLATQLSGKGAKLVAAAVKQGITFEVYHWPATLAVEKLVKRTKQTRRYCPACAAAAGRKPRPLPVPAVQLTLDLEELPEVAPLPMGRQEVWIMQRWRQALIPAPAGIDDDLL